MTHGEKRPQRRAYRDGKRWNEILDAATMSFREHGYDAATLQDIAGRVGMLKGSLYNYISSKEDLFVAVVERPAHAFMSRLAELRDDESMTALAKICDIIELQISIYASAYPAPFVYLGRVQSRSEPRFEQWDDFYVECLRDILAEGVKGGEFRRDIDIELASYALLGILAWMHAWYEPRGTETDGHIAREFWQLFVNGVAVNNNRPQSRSQDKIVTTR